MLTLEIVTPEGKAYTKEVEDVVLPTAEGEIDILPGHQPLITVIEAGEVQAGTGSGREFLAVDKGFARVLGDAVSVLTEGAIDVAEIDLSQVEEAQKRAEEALERAKNEKMDPAEIEKLEAVARFAIAQQLVKKRR
ncbi:ATP synthase F1 subunit epsilon [Rubellicoccus peritrichatus]|uniref:ATP synthase epsilon chain n=1 Tax=Rubellicoccus peritrichatus TaxID=3080537 RepID=A0AAQ3L9U5_9BACT|nr:ATP synthase F1 subunit epsilon [Puniceicoccus sp. CR14]WOO42284.1 ATP synthase F1 subunit epsilon [Puniceicoccus sp. CR14]